MTYNSVEKKEYYRLNRERILQSSKKHYKKNHDKIIQKVKDYYQKNHDKIIIKHRQYSKNDYKANPEKYIEKAKKFKENNLELVLSRQRIAQDKYRKSHKELVLKYRKEYEKNNHEFILIRKKKNRDTNKSREKRSTYAKEYFSRLSVKERTSKRYREDIQFKLSMMLRSRLSSALRGKQKAGSAVRDLGCTLFDFKIYLEKQFQEGMTWENRGKRGWHIDHRIPLSCVDLTNREEFIKACHYTNLQPLWWQDNLSKGNKIL